MSKMFIAGVTHQSGIGKTGNAYSMPRVVTLEPFNPVQNANLTRVGAGYVAGEMACTLEAPLAEASMRPSVPAYVPNTRCPFWNNVIGPNPAFACHVPYQEATPHGDGWLCPAR